MVPSLNNIGSLEAFKWFSFKFKAVPGRSFNSLQPVEQQIIFIWYMDKDELTFFLCQTEKWVSIKSLPLISRERKDVENIPGGRRVSTLSFIFKVTRLWSWNCIKCRFQFNHEFSKLLKSIADLFVIVPYTFNSELIPFQNEGLWQRAYSLQDLRAVNCQKM